MNFVENSIIWARKTLNDIYWPAKIVHIVDKMDTPWTDAYLNPSTSHASNYFIEYFISNESVWTNDILPYSQYREAMINHSFLQYGLHPSLKENFLHAVQQADHLVRSVPLLINSTNNSFLTPMPMEPMESSHYQVFSEPVEIKTNHDFLSTPTLTYESNSGYF